MAKLNECEKAAALTLAMEVLKIADSSGCHHEIVTAAFNMALFALGMGAMSKGELTPYDHTLFMEYVNTYER